MKQARHSSVWGRTGYALILAALAVAVAAPAAADVTCYRDADGDNYGDPTQPQSYPDACPDGWVLNHTDCNDANPDVHPGATEVCNGIDDNCVGGTDENNVCYTVFYCDGDEDDYASKTVSGTCNFYNCVPAGCQTTPGGDCNDDDPNIHPGATEVCNGVDDNCVNGVDEDDVCYVEYYCDEDVDTYVSAALSGDCNTFHCMPADCQTTAGDDCNDNNPNVHPGATELCNGLDDNCVNGVDEGGNSLCDDGVFCNGAETCLGAAGCGVVPACPASTDCLTVTCDEVNDECILDSASHEGDECSDGDYCTDGDACAAGVCVPGEARDCDDGIPCSFDICDSDEQQCVSNTDTCESYTVAPDCAHAVIGQTVELAVRVSHVNGEDDLGFTLNFNPSVVSCEGYTLEGGVLENWGATFSCATVGDDAVVCDGGSAVGVPSRNNALLATFTFAPTADKAEAAQLGRLAGVWARVQGAWRATHGAIGAPADDDDIDAAFAVNALQGDLQYMTAGQCVLTLDDDDDTSPDDDDDTSPDDDDNDTSPDDDDASPDDDDDNDVDDDDDDDDTGPFADDDDDNASAADDNGVGGGAAGCGC